MDNPFQSFWMAGYECTDKLNAFGNRVDFLSETGHLESTGSDYRLLDQLSIRTVREGLRWSQVEKTPYTYDWTETRKMIIAAREAKIQQVWDLCHFGYPDDLTPLHPLFARRFAAFARAFVLMYREMEPDLTLVITPINEVSFISWLGGDVAGTSPYCHHNGWQVKYQLMKAYIEGVEQLLLADRRIRILTTEPLINIIAAPDASNEMKEAAQSSHNDQFQVLDILCGKMCPELRGRPEYLDLLGYNYYYPNQWIHSTNERLDWLHPEREGGVSLSDLLETAYHRYDRPIVLSETSFPGRDRPAWIEMLGSQCSELLNKGIPLWGICWYPIIDRPDWDHLTPWHNAGIWDNTSLPGESSNRILHQPSFEMLQKIQPDIANAIARAKVGEHMFTGVLA